MTQTQHKGLPEMPPKRSIPVFMWVIAVLMLICCFLPWIKFPGRSALGFQNATHFWQGKVGIVLIVIALLAKQFRKHGISGICALAIPALAIHLWLQTAEVLRGIEPHFGAISLFILAIPFTVIAFDRSGFAPSTPPPLVKTPPPPPPPPPTPPPISARSERKPTPEPKPALAPFLIGGAATILLGLSAWWLLDLRHRHTLTTEERTKAESWFSDLKGKQWVLLTNANADVPEQGLDIVTPAVQADKYGKVSITVAIDLSANSTDWGLGRFSSKVQREYDDLLEPKELVLVGPAPDEEQLTWRIITTDSMLLSIRNAHAGEWDECIAIPRSRFDAMVAARKRVKQGSLLARVDSLLSGGGLLRRGIFRSYACGDECVASFLIVQNGQPVNAAYVCNNNRFGDLQLSQGNMIGEGDFTNQALVGQSFLIVTQRTLVETTNGGKAPVDVITGLLRVTNEDITPELQQRLAIATNVDMFAATGLDGSSATNVAQQYIDGGAVRELKDVQEQPEYPGGIEALYAYLGRNVKYPTLERDSGIQGRVYVEFTVASDGSIRDASIKRGVSKGLDREAIRVVSAMPRWTPGRLNGQDVNVRYILPVNFVLR